MSMINLKITKMSPRFKQDYAVGFYQSANEAWENLYYGLNKDGNESAPRGSKIKETLGCDIYIANPQNNLVYNSYRGLSPIYLAKEYFWYKSGDRSVEEASKLSKFWETLANPDGTVNSNYGAYIFVPEADGKSVWDKTIDILKKDPDSRQAIIQIPIMSARGSKDTPCTSSIQFFIRNNKLFATVYMRSTDVVLGFPIDIFQFTMWQCELAEALGVELGWIRFISGNIHCYEKHWIENVDDEFHFAVFTEGIYSDLLTKRASVDFQDDLINLSNYKKGDKIPEFDEPLFKTMLENKKIWKL